MRPHVETARPVAEEGERVDLAPVSRREDDHELVDLKPIVRRPSISAPSTPTEVEDDTPAPQLFDRPRVSAPTVDPEPVGSIDDHPTVFGADEQSPLEGLRVPDSADGMAEPTDLVDDSRS